MRILFLSHYFPPEVNAPATRTYEHCKEWVASGHDVTVISCVPNHPMGKAYTGYKNKLIHVENVDGIKVVRLLTYITANEGFFKRTVNYVFYMMMAILVSPFLSRPHIVISTTPQFFNGLAGYFVAKIKRAPWLVEVRDLWPESILAVGAIKNKTLIKTLEWLECFLYRKADFIVPVTMAFKRHILERGGREKAIEVIRNGANLEQFIPTEYSHELAEKWGVSNKFVASYVGTHGMAHGLTIVLDAAELLKDREDIVFLMVGDGAERERLVAERDRRQLSNVIMVGQQPKDMMPNIWAISNISLVLLKRMDLFKTVIPSKIFESMAMQTPIVLGVEGEVEEIIKQSRAGVCIEPESAEALASAVLRLCDDSVFYTQLSSEGRDYVAAEFDRKRLAANYLKLLEKVA